jgi:cobalt/nickel transport protein
MKKKDIFVALTITLAVGAFSFLASSLPDGLERVASDKNFLKKAYNAIKSPIPEYLFPGMHNEKIATVLAGILGVLLIYFLAMGLAKFLVRHK